jgi:hypothetical protein
VIFKLFVCRCEARSGPRRATAHLVVGQVPERRARLQGCAGKGTDVSASALERSGVRGTQSAHAPFEPRGIRTFCFRCGSRVFLFLETATHLEPSCSPRVSRPSRAGAVARIVRPVGAVGGRSEPRAARRVRARATVRAVGTSPGESHRKVCGKKQGCEGEIGSWRKSKAAGGNFEVRRSIEGLNFPINFKVGRNDRKILLV